MYMVRCARSSQTATTKAIIAEAKKAISNGSNWKSVLEEAEKKAEDNVQKQKIITAIINYI